MRRLSLSDLALNRPVTVGMALLAILLLGVIGLTRLPLAFLPTGQSARAYVRVYVSRTTPEILEREVIRPLEERIAGMRDLDKMQSGSGSWGVRANLEFRPGTDIDARKLELRDRLERLRPDLPEFVERVEIGSYTMMDDPAVELVISSDADLTEDYYLIEERVVRPLERIDGVARVELEGVSPHEVEVALDLDAVDASGVDPRSVSTAVRDARSGRSLGVLRGATHDPGVRSPNAPVDPDALARLPIAAPAPDGSTRSGQVGDVARVTAHPEERRSGRRLDGRPAINLEVYITAGASVVEVAQRVRAEVDSLRSDPGMRGIQVVVFHDQGQTVLKTLGDLRNTGLWGGLFGVIVLFAFLRRFRTTLAASLSIPLSVLAACAILFLRGDELNCIVLLGLVLGVGMLIDNSVVIVEAIEQQMQRGKDALVAARLGARDVGLATIASTLSSVIVFLPLIFGNPADPMSAFLAPLGITFAIALICSLFMSQLAVPLLMGRALIPSSRPVHHPFLDKLSAAYGAAITRTLRFPRLTALFGLLLAASAVVPAMNMNMKFGDVDEKPDHLPVRLQMSGSRGFEQVQARVEVMEQALLPQKAELGIRTLTCSYRDWGGKCRVYPADVFESEADSEAFEETIAAALPEQPGITYRLGERDFHWRENRDRKVVDFAIKGEDMGTLMKVSKEVAQHLSQRLKKGDSKDPDAGGYDLITSPFTEGSKELNVLLEADRLRRHQLTADQVSQSISLAFQGMRLGQARGPRGEVSLRLSVVEDEEAGAGLARLRDLRIAKPDGSQVTLGSLSTIEQVSSPFWVQRADRQTEVRIQVRFFSDDADANWERVQDAMSNFGFPSGYSWGKGTQWRKRKESGNEMLVNLGLCLLLVYAVMASLFESFLQPLAILVTCLFGCFGAPWALWLTNTTLDTTAVIGLFILIGIVVNNGIMLIDKVTQLRMAGMARGEALAMAGRRRLRPILMTASTTILGLVPMLIHHPTLAGVYYHSIAIVIAGGLATSTVVTLVVLPSIYELVEDTALAARAHWRKIHP